MNQDLPLNQTDSQLSSAYRPLPGVVPSEFRRPLERLEDLVQKFTGQRPPAAPAAAWDRFLSFPEPKRFEISGSWVAQADFIEGAIEAGLKSFDEIGMLGHAMGRLHLLGDSSLFSSIEQDDLVEILSPDFLQVYRSFSYFALCNYSLLELSSYAFFELYERSSMVLNQLLEFGAPVLEGKANSVSLEQMPEYTIRELMTEEGSLFSMRERALFRIVSSLTGASYVISVKKVRALPTPARSSSVAFI